MFWYAWASLKKNVNKPLYHSLYSNFLEYNILFSLFNPLDLILFFIIEDADKGWRIVSDTTIKAKSIKGFNTAASKIIENKFILDEETKELLEDWDTRTVKSVLELHDNQGDLNCCEFQENTKKSKFRGKLKLMIKAQQ